MGGGDSSHVVVVRSEPQAVLPRAGLDDEGVHAAVHRSEARMALGGCAALLPVERPRRLQGQDPQGKGRSSWRYRLLSVAPHFDLRLFKRTVSRTVSELLTERSKSGCGR